MKLVTYAQGGSEQAGIVIDEQVYPLSGLGLPASIVELLALEEAGLEQLAKAAKTASGGVAVSEVKLLPVIPRPPAIFLLAGNYQSHIMEGGGKAVNKAEITPRLFIKPVTSVIGDGDPILIPTVSDTVDYELEIAAGECMHGRRPSGRAEVVGEDVEIGEVDEVAVLLELIMHEPGAAAHVRDEGRRNPGVAADLAAPRDK